MLESQLCMSIPEAQSLSNLAILQDADEHAGWETHVKQDREEGDEKQNEEGDLGF